MIDAHTGVQSRESESPPAAATTSVAATGSWRESPAILGILGSLGALATWDAASRLGIVPTTYVPPATTVIRNLAHEATTGPFWTSVGATLEQWLIGFGLSVLIAVPIGLLFGTVDLLWIALRPLVEFLRPVPGMALIPLTVLIWGLSVRSVVFLTVFGCIWSLIVASMYGARGVDGGARDTARSFQLSARQRARWVTLPSSLPYIATGLRVTSATALMIVVGSELVVGVDGIGSDIAMAQTAGDFVGMYSLILAAGIIGIVVHIVFSRLERHYLHWHPSQRTAEL